jgi:ZIP family zinc transporter
MIVASTAREPSSGEMATWLLAALIGLLAASGLFIGALVGYTDRLPHRAIATVMGFGAGVLVAVLTLELVAESRERGSIVATATGFLAELYSSRSVTGR